MRQRFATKTNHMRTIITGAEDYTTAEFEKIKDNLVENWKFINSGSLKKMSTPESYTFAWANRHLIAGCDLTTLSTLIRKYVKSNLQ